VEYLERTIVSGDVKLIPRASVEGVSWVRPNLGHDAEGTEQAERSAGDRRIADVEMDRNLPATPQVHAPRRMEEP
jgi:hypothetical protein